MRAVEHDCDALGPRHRTHQRAVVQRQRTLPVELFVLAHLRRAARVDRAEVEAVEFGTGAM